MEKIIEEVTVQIIEGDDEFFLLMKTPAGSVRSQSVNPYEARNRLFLICESVIKYAGKQKDTDKKPN